MNEETQTAQSKHKRVSPAVWGYLEEGAFYLGVLLTTLFLFLLFKPYAKTYRAGVVAQSLMAVGLGACAVFAAYMGMTKRLTSRHIVILFLIAGYIIRVGYMLYTSAATRQQDTYTKNFDGHEAYAWTIFQTGKLPTDNPYQFYHPPLNAMVQAAFMRFMNGLTKGFGEDFFARYAYSMPKYVEPQRFFLYSTCQILATTYSFITAVVMLKILKELGFTGKLYLFLAAFVVFYPRQIQFSGMLNNDGISYLLAILALYFALRWWKGGKSLVYILLCGLSVGLGMMAKLSSATICIPIAGIFIYEFIRTLLGKEDAFSLWKMVLQYGLFMLICAPIGLWFQVYAYIRFDQPFGYVFDNLNKKLYTGHHSLFSRLIFTLDLNEHIGTLYCRPFSKNYNLFAYALRSSIFGEFSYWQGEGFAVLSILIAYTVSLLLLVALVYCAVFYFKKRKAGEKIAPLSHKELLFTFLLVQSQVLSEMYFYIKMPYGCTMDFRYIMPLILGLALTVGYTQKTLALAEGKWAKTLSNA
ncbi:MAG: hypothetical protein IKB20_02790, partial [Clostridia bacterium]|nr:hypothetical protein [Clostridia bacterium]